MRQKKKGISPIIATVIIVAITVIAGIILYGLVQPLIKQSITKTACTEVTYELDSQATCVYYTKDLLIPEAWNSVQVSIDRTQASDDEPQVVGWMITVGSGVGQKRSYDSRDIAPYVGPPPNPQFSGALWTEVMAGDQKTQVLDLNSTIITNLGNEDISYLQIYPVITREKATEDCPTMAKELLITTCS
jgi:flagellin-like protein